MQQELFLKNKISRQIKQNGSSYHFQRLGTDKYGQLTDEIVGNFFVDGLFHEIVRHVSISESDNARVVDVPKPYILCLYDDGKPLELDDFVEINTKIYKVISKTNVGNFNIAFDISLRLIANDEVGN